MSKDQKAYLVNIGNPTRWIAVPFGLAFISRALSIEGLDYEVIDLLPIKPDEREQYFKDKLSGISDGIFGFGIMLGNCNLQENLRYADMVKEASPNNTLVVGGAAPTALADLLLQNSQVDYIVLGEGEERFITLLKELRRGKTGESISGVLSKRTSAIIPTSSGEHSAAKLNKIKNLDMYSPPLYDVFDMKFYVDYLKESNRCFDIAASRGCWADCDFCFKFIGTGYHARSADSLLNEIEHVIEAYGHSDFAFTDENFFQNKRMFFELMNKAKERKIDFRFRCMTRVDNLDEEMTAALSDANCLGVSFGIESANNETLTKFGKRTNVAEIERKISYLHKAGIEARGAFIIGFPEDTEDDYKVMYSFIDNNGLAGHCTVNHLTPLPATRLYRQYKDKITPHGEWEYINRVDQASLFRDLVVNLTTMPDEKLLYYRNEIKELGQGEMVLPVGFRDYLKDHE